MSSIHGVGNSPVSKVTTAKVSKQLPATPAKQLPATDRLELSGVSHLLKALKSNDIRADKVATIKSQIESGKYESAKKLDGAIEKLLSELNS